MEIVLVLILSFLFSGCQSAQKLTPAFIYSKGDLDLSGYPIGKNPKCFLLNVKDREFEKKTSNISESYTPVVFGAGPDLIHFNLSSYYQELNTSSYGKTIISVDTTTSTMYLANAFGTLEGLAVVANQQTAGIASNNGSWDSPRGDVYFNINVRLSNQSRSGLLPGLCAISFIQAVLGTPSDKRYQQLPINYSWPISTAWMPWNKKIGGVLVWPVEDHGGYFNLGCGLRVNSEIQYTVSKVIDEFNAKQPEGNKLPQLELPSLIARAVNNIERNVKLLDNEPEIFQKLVLDIWMNGQRIVKLSNLVKVTGITMDGLLIVNDGNDFKGFIAPNMNRFGFEPINVYA